MPRAKKHYHGIGVAKDYALAAKHSREAAELGHVSAQFTLGWLYRNGWGVPQDLTEAVVWYQRAAEKNHADAQRNMGLAYRYGWGVTVDLIQSLRWYPLRRGTQPRGCPAQHCRGLRRGDRRSEGPHRGGTLVWLVIRQRIQKGNRRVTKTRENACDTRPQAQEVKWDRPGRPIPHFSMEEA